MEEAEPGLVLQGFIVSYITAPCSPSAATLITTTAGGTDVTKEFKMTASKDGDAGTATDLGLRVDNSLALTSSLPKSLAVRSSRGWLRVSYPFADCSSRHIRNRFHSSPSERRPRVGPFVYRHVLREGTWRRRWRHSKEKWAERPEPKALHLSRLLLSGEIRLEGGFGLLPSAQTGSVIRDLGRAKASSQRDSRWSDSAAETEADTDRQSKWLPSLWVRVTSAAIPDPEPESLTAQMKHVWPYFFLS